MRWARVCVVTVSAWLLAMPVNPQAVGGQPDVKPAYEVYAVSYGLIPDLSLSWFVRGADPTRKTDLQMTVWLLRGPNRRNVLVDSGFFREKHLQQWAVKNFIRPTEAIAKLGLQPDDITDIIITHMHWDHAGGVELFPKARVWVQKEEYVYYTGEAWQSEDTHAYIDPEDVIVYTRLNTEGRLKFVYGDNQEIIPGVTCYTGGRHTYASQYVEVHTKIGAVVIASDNVYLYENLEKRAPIGIALDSEANLKAQDRMRQIASNPGLIVPGHDPAVFKRFPQLADGVATIAK